MKSFNSISDLSNKDYENLSFILSSNVRTEIILAIANGIVIPSKKRKSLNQKFSIISKNLKDMENREIIICKTPFKRKGRIYNITSITEKLIPVILDNKKD